MKKKLLSLVCLVALVFALVLPSSVFAAETPVTWIDGSLTKAFGNGITGTKANLGKETGKWYWELKVNASSSNVSTIAIVGEGPDVPGIQSSDYLFGYFGYNGHLLSHNSDVSYGSSYTTGDVIGVALDLDNDTVVWYKNGVSQGSNIGKPSQLTGTKVFPAVFNTSTSNSSSTTANFGVTKFAYSIPTGFLPYDSTGTANSGTTPGTDPGTTPGTGTDRAILTITLVGGIEKEYDLSSTELSAFLTWYDTKATGVGAAKYGFNKTWNKGPFKTRTEYVIFDKIVTFNVDGYDLPTK